MGQYLAIGLVIETKVDKEVLIKYKISKDELLESMIQKLHFAPELYDVVENEYFYMFNLKHSVFSEQLIPFLEKFYPVVYSDDEYKSTLEILKNKESTEWIEYSESRGRDEFRFDKYAECDFIRFPNTFMDIVKVSQKSIMLSIEGKILVESHHRQFNFFKFCIQQTFSEFSLAKALRVYITG